VRDVKVLERIADGLGVRRELMRILEHAPDGGAYPGQKAPQSREVQEVTDDVLRRDALALGSLAAFGQVVVGTLAGKIPHPGRGPLPSRLGMTDVAEIAAETERLRTAARAAGGQARNAVAAAGHYRALTRYQQRRPWRRRWDQSWPDCTSSPGGAASTPVCTDTLCGTTAKLPT